MKVMRVFPRKTTCTPIDDLVRFDDPGWFDPAYLDEIHISVTWTYDLKRAEELYKSWNRQYPNIVKIGGPATGERGEDFIPGKYLKNGYVITSRGCYNKCWFCSVWKREGNVRELPITQGYNILDDNLLACSDDHIKAVFKMLSNQKEKVEFTGGLEAAILKKWQAVELKKLNPKQMFFAYDTPEDKEPLFEAGKLLLNNGFSVKTNVLRAYVLIGFPEDSFESAEKRLYETIDAGFMPMAMLWKNDKGGENREWRKFQREWARPAIIYCKMKEYRKGNNI